MSKPLTLRRGDTVSAITHGNITVDLVVVEDRGDVVRVCNAEEYARAIRTGTPPVGVGFKRSMLRKDGEA